LAYSRSLDEANAFFIALEDTADLLSRLVERQPVQRVDLIAPMAAIEYQLRLLADRLGYAGGDTDAR
jgi:hypothetical protein